MSDLDKLLESISRSAEADAEGNRRVLDNHLMASDRVIANVAALRAANTSEAELAGILEAASRNPT